MKPLFSIKITGPLCLLAIAGTCAADVTLQQSVTVDASGSMSMMSSTGTVTTAISNNRGRTENRMEPGSKLMKSFAKNLNTATVVLLEDEKMLSLMPDEQKYSEVTFAQMRAQMEEGMAQMEQMQAGGGLPVSEGDCQWSDPIVNVQSTGNKQKFAGVKAKQTMITASQSCTVPDTGKSCDMTWNLEYWNAKKMPGDDEAREFQENMARAMGGDELLALAKVNTRGLMAMFKGGWDDVLAESGELEGYPVKTVMSLEMGGEQCTTAAGQPIAMDDVWNQAADAGLDAAAGTAASHAGSAVGRGTANAVGNGVGGSVAGSAIGAASQKLIGSAFSKFRKKKKEEEPAVAPENPAAGSVTLFKVTTELTSVSKKDIANSEFEVPAEWQKVESATW